MMTTGQHPRERDVVAQAFEPGAAPRAVPLSALPALVAADENFVWVDIHSPAHESLYAVAELLDLPHGAVRAMLSPWRRPHPIRFDRRLFVSVLAPRLDVRAADQDGYRVDLFLGRNVLVSAHTWDTPALDRARARAGRDADQLRRDAGHMLTIVLDELVRDALEAAWRTCWDASLLKTRARRDTADAVLGDLLRVRRDARALADLADTYRPIVAMLPTSFSSGAEAPEEGDSTDIATRLDDLRDTARAATEAADVAFTIYLARRARRGATTITPAAVVGSVLTVAIILAAVALTVGYADVALRDIPGATPVGAARILTRILVRVVMIGLIALLLIRWRSWLAARRVTHRNDGGMGRTTMRDAVSPHPMPPEERT